MRTQPECLMKLTLEELADLGFRLLVKPPENRRSRRAWSEVILPAMQSAREVLTCLALEEWDAIGVHARRHGGDEALTASFSSVSRIPLLDDALAELRLMGLAWRDVHCWHLLPQALEMARLAEQEHDSLVQIENSARIMAGFLMLYGMVPAREMQRMVAGGKGRDEEMALMLTELHRKRYGLAGILAQEGCLWLVGPGVSSPLTLYEQVTGEEMLAKPYASYSVEEALYTWREGLPGRMDAYDEILELFAAQGLETDVAKDCLSETIALIQNGFVDEAVSTLAEAFTHLPSLKEMRTLGLLMARVPMWHLKGRCAEDLLPSTVRLTDRVRQDDPCPCGSGRKYKHCCGRLQ